MDCDRIASNLFVGSCLLDRKEVEELRSLGVTAILSLQTEQDMGKRGIDWEEKEALSRKAGLPERPLELALAHVRDARDCSPNAF